MKVLFIHPEIRLDDKPYDYPFAFGIFASVLEKKGAQVAILDLNALRMNYGGENVPSDLIKQEIASEKWDMIGIGGLTTTYARIKQLIPIMKKSSPEALIISGGGWCTYNPDEIFHFLPEIDVIGIGEGEETVAEIYDEVENGSRDFENIKGLCINNNGKFTYTQPRALISDMDTIPFPDYNLFEMDIYFKFSSFPFSREAFNSKRRGNVVWQRGCPRGCTFCSHNGMSRIDIQNIYGLGDRIKGEKMARQIDKDNDTFQLPARWPSPKYAIENIKILKENYDIDFLRIEDENMLSNKKWTEEFCKLYMDEGFHETVKWGVAGDAPSAATHPDLVKLCKEAGCSYIAFGFESASDKVLKQDIEKGQTQKHLQITIDIVKKVGLRPLATFMIGNPHEDINDLMESVMFWIRNNLEIDPFICTPFIGSPLLYKYRDFVLQQYDHKLKLAKERDDIDKKTLKEWELKALDKFMTECGDAFQYTATVSQYFTIPELFALKRFMYRHDTRRMLQMAHQRYDQTGLKQWKHDEKWNAYCQICESKEQLSPKIKVLQE